MPCLGGGRRLVWDRSDVVARCDGGREGGTGGQFGGREGGSGGAARDEGAGAGRRESGAASGGARGDVGGAIGSSRAPTRSGFFSPARRSDPRGVASGGGAVDRRAIAVASARARANSPARRPLRSSRRRGRTRSRRVGSAAAFPRAGARPGKAVGRPGASARPTAEPQKAKKACGTTPGNRRARAARRLAHLRSASQPRVRVCASIASMGGLVCGARRRFWRARPTAPPSVRKPSHTRNVATCASRTSASWRTQKRTNKQSPKLEFLRLFFFRESRESRRPREYEGTHASFSPRFAALPRP